MTPAHLLSTVPIHEDDMLPFFYHLYPLISTMFFVPGRRTSPRVNFLHAAQVGPTTGNISEFKYQMFS